MEIIVHYPNSPEQRKELTKLAGKVHSQYIAAYLNKLSCPIEQKKKLIDDVAATMRERCGSSSGKVSG